MRIPIVDLRAQYAKIRDEVRSAIDEVAESQQFILGPAVTQFEAQMAMDGQETFAGAIGDLGCFSFFPSKNLGGFGDGGLVSANSSELAARLRMLRVHGESAMYHHAMTGINSRLDSLQAAVLSVKQRYLETWCEQRIERGQIYHRLFRESAVLGAQVVTIPAARSDRSHVFNSYVIRAERRNALKQFLAESAIQSEVYYPLPLHLQKCFADLGYQRGDFPKAESAANQVLALPLYPELTLAQQEAVVETVGTFYRR